MLVCCFETFKKHFGHGLWNISTTSIYQMVHLCRRIVCAFTTVPWSSDPGYHNDDSAVLFSFDLANPDNIVISRATPGYNAHVWYPVCTYSLPVTCLHLYMLVISIPFEKIMVCEHKYWKNIAYEHFLKKTGMFCEHKLLDGYDADNHVFIEKLWYR